jgi:hypothetical protein
MRTAPRDAEVAMRIARTLESLGAGSLHDGVYLLPRRDDLVEALARISDHVTAAGGQSEVLSVDSAGEEQDERLRAIIDHGPQYDALAINIRSVAGGIGLAETWSVARVLRRQRDELDRLNLMDHLHGPAALAARAALDDAQQRLEAAIFDTDEVSRPAPAPLPDPLFRCIWATRDPLSADRLASAWLIRRFIDVEAHFIWLDRDEHAPPLVVSFGFPGARIASAGGRITFERLLVLTGLDHQPALTRLGRAIRELELGRHPVAQAQPIEVLLEGAARRAASDPDSQLSAAELIFDQVYETFLDQPGRGRR